MIKGVLAEEARKDNRTNFRKLNYSYQYFQPLFKATLAL